MVERKTLLRYVLSFLSVLLLPLAAFFLIYNDYFISLYRSEVLSWYERDLDKLNDGITKHVSFMQYAAGQFSNQKSMKKDRLFADYPGYVNITNTLSSIVYAQDFFTFLAFYSGDVPDTVFTNVGTYNVGYYKQYRLEDGSWGNVKAMLKSVGGSSWIIPANIRSTDGALSREVEYVLPVPGTAGDYALFSIPERRLRELSSEYASNTVILTGTGEQIYPFVPQTPELLTQIMSFVGASGWVQTDRETYLFVRSVKGTDLVSAILLPENQVLYKVTVMQKQFLLIFLLLLLTGGITVFFMVFINYRPIRRLVTQAKEVMGGDACEFGDIEAVTYALESMSRRFGILKEEASREKNILKLVYGRNENTAAMEDEIRQLNLPLEDACYRVLALCLEESTQGVDGLSLLMEYGGQVCQVAAMEYLHNRCYLAVMCGDPEGHKLRSQMERLVHIIEKESGVSVCVAAGESCGTPEELPRSFRQAMRLGSDEVGVHFFEKDRRGPSLFLYPSIDIHTLKCALEEGNGERASLVTDMLMDTARDYTGRPFIAISICCEVINSYLSAFKDWKLSPDEMVDVYSMYSSFYSFTDVETLIEDALRIKETGLKIIEAIALQEETVDFATMVVAYIDEHLAEPDFCISRVADEFGLSTSNLSHRFKALTGMNISDYINERRMIYARTLLSGSELTVNQIAQHLGYTQSSNFIRKFKAAVGMTPNEYRSGLKGGGQTGRETGAEKDRKPVGEEKQT